MRLEPLGPEEARSSAEALLIEITGGTRSSMLLNRSQQVSGKIRQAYETAIERRRDRWPLSYITGTAYFWEERLAVTTDCLIPRPETECLVEAFIRDSGFKSGDSFVFLDLGSGSGAIGIALLRHFENAKAFFLDISPEALAVTRRNLEAYGLQARATLMCSDLFEKLPPVRFDAVFSNPPYFCREDWGRVEPEVLREPKTALDGGADGLDFYRRIAAGVRQRLNPGGLVLVEMGQGQSPDVELIFRNCGFEESLLYKDALGIERVLMTRNRID